MPGNCNDSPVLLSPFADAAAFEPQAFEQYCDWAHRVSAEELWAAEQSNLPPWTYPVVAYKDVKNFISSPETPRGATLAPFPPDRPFTDVRSIVAAAPNIVRAMLMPKATANSTGETHDKVIAATFTNKDDVDSASRGLSRRHEVMEARYSSLITECVDGALDSLAAALDKDEVVDIGSAFASPLAAQIISRIIGFPREDEDKVRGWSEAQTDLLGRVLSPSHLKVGVRGLMSMYDACRSLVKERRREPAHDLASYIGMSDLPDKHVAAVLMNLMAAGYSTSYGSNLNILHRLLSDPERHHWNALEQTADRNALVKELLRLDTALVGWKVGADGRRLSDGTVSPSKGTLILMLAAANRDPDHFSNPHEVRPGRRGQPLTFGLGRHMCMGMDVAIMETTAVLVGVRETLPCLSLAHPAERITYRGPDMLFRAPSELLVRRTVQARI